MWDPAFAASLVAAAAANQQSLVDPWAPFLVVDEADDLFGFDKMTHTHMGYVILSQNPDHPRSIKVPSAGLLYSDPRLFAKYALRDFLRSRYRAASDQLPVFDFRKPVPQYNYSGTALEAAALARLNSAWNSSYVIHSPNYSPSVICLPCLPLSRRQVHHVEHSRRLGHG
jgi:hypothetical protein